MDKIPGFDAFAKAVLNFFGGVRTARNQGRWPMLIAYIVFVIIVLIVVIFGSIGAVVGGLEATGVIKENIYAPKRDLSYQMKSQTDNPDGGYTTVFSLTLSDPQGNLNKFIYSYPLGCEKTLRFIEGGNDFREGILYAVGHYEVLCNTKEPIVENYKLFELR